MMRWGDSPPWFFQAVTPRAHSDVEAAKNPSQMNGRSEQGRGALNLSPSSCLFSRRLQPYWVSCFSFDSRSRSTLKHTRLTNFLVVFVFVFYLFLHVVNLGQFSSCESLTLAEATNQRPHSAPTLRLSVLTKGFLGMGLTSQERMLETYCCF